MLRQFPFKLEVIEQIIEPIKRKLEAIKPTHENKSVDDAIEFLKAVIELSTKRELLESNESALVLQIGLLEASSERKPTFLSSIVRVNMPYIVGLGSTGISSYDLVNIGNLTASTQSLYNTDSSPICAQNQLKLSSPSPRSKSTAARLSIILHHLASHLASHQASRRHVSLPFSST